MIEIILEHLGDIIASLALLLSGFATYKALKFRKSEKELVEIQKKLNQLMFEKEKREVEEASKADLGANFISLGNSQHRLKVFNKGKSTAYNIRIEFPDGNDIVSENDLEDKFPLEILERGQSVELVAIFHFKSKSKLKMKLIWQDELKNEYDKTVYPTR